MTFEEQPTTKKVNGNVIGAMIDNHYEILDVISSGGAGEVFKVRNVEMDTIAAAKVMHSDTANSADHANRFKREAQILCKLRHPNIVSVHRFGIDQRFGPYLIMDLIDGVPLSKIIKEQGALPLEKASKLLTQICDGMSAAHSLGIVHRDIKPSNVMVRGSGENQQAIIIDFGTGKFLQGNAQKLTQTAAVMGTPLYMAPEQCLSEQVDKRTDVYSMGCLIYEVLTGKPPFTGESSFEVMNKHLKEMPPPPSVANPRARIPKQIDEVIEMALKKDPSARIDTFTRFKEALDAARQRPTYAKLFLPRIEPKSFVSRSNLKIALLLALIGIAFFAFEIFKNSSSVQSNTNDPSALRASVSLRDLEQLHNEYFRARRVRDAAEVQKELVAYFRNPAHSNKERVVEHLDGLAAELAMSGQDVEADKTYKELIAASTEFPAWHDDACLGYSSFLVDRFRHVEALAVLKELEKNQNSMRPFDKWVVQFRLAKCYLETDGGAEALAASKAGLELLSEMPADSTAVRDYGSSNRLFYAASLRKVGKPKQALTEAIEALRLFQASPHRASQNPHYTYELAMDYFALGQLDRAKLYKKQTLKMLEQPIVSPQQLRTLLTNLQKIPD